MKDNTCAYFKETEKRWMLMVQIMKQKYKDQWYLLNSYLISMIFVALMEERIYSLENFNKEQYSNLFLNL